MPDETKDLSGVYIAKHRFFFGDARDTEAGGKVRLSHADAEMALKQGTVHPDRVEDAAPAAAVVALPVDPPAPSVPPPAASPSMPPESNKRNR